MTKFILAGDLDNWMDLRDKFIEFLQTCDTEAKLDRFITGIFRSVCPSPESINVLREELGIKKLSKKELKKLTEIYEESESK